MVLAAVDSDHSRARPGRRRWIVLLAVTMAAAIAGVVVPLINGARQLPTCPVATSPLGALAASPQTPRLCDLGAPSQVLGSGRLDGTSWRVVVTPPRPWRAYYSAGFGPELQGGVTGKTGSCVFVVSGGSPVLSCASWQLAGLAGKFVSAEWDGGRISVGYGCLDARATYFDVVPADGPEVKVAAVHYLGMSCATFALPASAGKPAVMAAYGAHGRTVATTTF
jgi:hypothetical protein